MPEADFHPVQDRIEVAPGKHKELGVIIYDWIMHNEPWPVGPDIDNLKNRLIGADGTPLLLYPSRLTNFEIVQSTLDKFIIRLPAPEVAKAGKDRVCVTPPPDPSEYGEPFFYKRWVNRPNPDINACDFFFSRVGDYTMNMCK